MEIDFLNILCNQLKLLQEKDLGDPQKLKCLFVNKPRVSLIQPKKIFGAISAIKLI